MLAFVLIATAMLHATCRVQCSRACSTNLLPECTFVDPLCPVSTKPKKTAIPSQPMYIAREKTRGFSLISDMKGNTERTPAYWMRNYYFPTIFPKKNKLNT